MLAKKKEKTEKVQRRFEKEKEINWWFCGGERQEEVEEELESDDPMELGDNTTSSEGEEDGGTAMTLVEHR